MISYSGAGSDDVGTVATYICNTGYTLIEGITRTVMECGVGRLQCVSSVSLWNGFMEWIFY